MTKFSAEVFLSMRLILLTAMCIAAECFAMPAFAQSDDAAALLAKNAAYTGFASPDAAQMTWTATGTQSGARATGSFSETRRGLLFRDTVATPSGITDTTGFSGSTVWHADANGFTVSMLGSPARAIFGFNMVRAGMASAVRGASVVGHAVVRGTNCAILRMAPASGSQMDVYEDPATGAFLRAVVDPTGRPSTFDVLSYISPAPGRKIVGTWSVDGTTYSIAHVDMRSSVPDADVAAPRPTAVWTFGSDQVPITYATEGDNDRRIRVEASVNGHSGVFLLSTSTPSIVLYEPFAGRAGVSSLGTSGFSPYQGNVDYQGYGRAATIAVGSSVLRNAIVQRIFTQNSSLAGVLGFDFFADALVNVDLKARRLQLLDPAQYVPKVDGSAYAFPVNLTDRTPAVAMRLPKGAIAYPTLDSGLSGFMILSQQLSDTRQVDGVPISDAATVGFGGQGATADPIAATGMNITYTAWNTATTSGTCETVPRLQIGPYAYTNPPLCFGGTNIFGDDRGLIGMDFLRHFNWTIDYPDAKFVLTPNGD